ncbi:WYL domain-containing protein [Frankia sp. CNm7]|uniref:WYL domain-containing protein n=1 Tax=Frankia nepalensis TaxID=1836974 RepID=A0A937RH76_9ACTN|nr:WYL domain-containing protein [Frankia nepalensis]MBL7497415.1 WYL domain-containing protein [Frankia nepalensis]MBL7512749.1 WYL domain-containing protein [Frankia nepalensis]MBL7517821.1 WYL domain-containing protein [Frankia nepalensis]MBL7632148.1 WYL domain-containing protein [Frankia nepalensis]
MTAAPVSAVEPPPITLTEEQAAAVAVALVALPPGPLSGPAQAALHEVLTALGPAGQDRVAELAARLWSRPDGLPRTPATPVIEEAMHEGVAVAVDYVNAAGRASHRRIEPHAFAYARGNWYLMAWCLDKDAPRWFRWDRIGHAELTTTPVQWREAFSVFPAPSPRA